MTHNQIVDMVVEEINKKNFGVTEQFLTIHELVLVDGTPKIERIDNDDSEGSLIVYMPVKDESFYFSIYFDTKPNTRITGVGTEPYSCVYLHATSDEMNLEQLSSLTVLNATGGWSKGDKRKIGDGSYKFSSIKFEPNPEPDEFEDKLKKLLKFLERDKSGIKALAEKANGYIQVAMKFHNGNTMIGGPHIDKQTIGFLNDLNLSIDFDLYAEGNHFSEA